MDSDDAQIGYVFTRREALALLGAAGVTVLGGYGLHGSRQVYGAMRPPSCIVRPQQTEGPYFVDAKLDRSDIRPDPVSGTAPEGARFELAFHVSRIGGTECRPLADALVDVWQCDAVGIYSDVRDTSGRFDTAGQLFLRGHQSTDAQGTARFVTIFPGWYEGRTVHIHFKIRTAPASGRTYEFTSQLYFDDDFTDRVMRLQPYASKGPRPVRNAQDGIYRRGGEQLLIAANPAADGYSAVFDIGLQLD